MTVDKDLRLVTEQSLEDGPAADIMAVQIADPTSVLGEAIAGTYAAQVFTKLVTLGPGGDYSTLNAALVYIGQFHQAFRVYAAPSAQYKTEPAVELRQLSGFVMAEQVYVEAMDLSFITVTSEDACVPVTRSALTIKRNRWYAAWEFNANAVSPQFSCLYNMDASGLAANKVGFYPHNGSALLFADRASDARPGFINSGERNVDCAENARMFHTGREIYAPTFSGSVTTFASQPVGVATNIGVRLSNGSLAAMGGVKINGTAVAAWDCGGFSSANLPRCDFTDNQLEGLLVGGNGIVYAIQGSFDRNGRWGERLRDGKANTEGGHADLCGTSAWAATTAYVVGQWRIIGVTLVQCTVAGTSGATIPATPTAVGAVVTDGSVTWVCRAINEVQVVTVTGAPTGGTFTLTYSGQTATIAYNATAAAMQAALIALSTIGTGGVEVTGGPDGVLPVGTPYRVTFSEGLGNVLPATMTKNAGGLTGGTSPDVTVAVAARVAAGGGCSVDGTATLNIGTELGTYTAFTATKAAGAAFYASNQGHINGDHANGTGAATYAFYAEDQGDINVPNSIGDSAAIGAYYANRDGRINGNAGHGTGCGVFGARANVGSRNVNMQGANLSGAGTVGIDAQNGSFINAQSANAQRGGSPSATDIRVLTGSEIVATGATGGLSQLENERTPSGLITTAGGSTQRANQTGGDLSLPVSDATTWTTVPGTIVTLQPGIYSLSGYIEVEGSTASDIRLRFLPGGGLAYSGSYSSNGLPNTTASTAGTINKAAQAWGTTSPFVTGLDGAGVPVTLSPTGLLVVTTAGTIQLQATQGTADASTTKVRNVTLKFEHVG